MLYSLYYSFYSYLLFFVGEDHNQNLNENKKQLTKNLQLLKKKKKHEQKKIFYENNKKQIVLYLGNKESCKNSLYEKKNEQNALENVTKDAQKKNADALKN